MTMYPDYPPPQQPAKPKKNHLFVKIVLGIITACLLMFGGCAIIGVAAIGGAASDIADEQAAHAITPKQFKNLEPGTKKHKVEKRLGAPMDRQDFQSTMDDFDGAGSTTYRSSCIYYNRAGDDFAAMYQLCFDNGKLTSKNAY